MKITLAKPATGKSAQWVLDYSKPALVGTDKQIAWVNEIRDTFEAEFASKIVKATKSDLMFISADFGCQEWIDAQGRVTSAIDKQNSKGQSIANCADVVFANNSAAYWIDNKMSSILVLINNVTKEA